MFLEKSQTLAITAVVHLELMAHHQQASCKTNTHSFVVVSTSCNMKWWLFVARHFPYSQDRRIHFGETGLIVLCLGLDCNIWTAGLDFGRNTVWTLCSFLTPTLYRDHCSLIVSDPNTLQTLGCSRGWADEGIHWFLPHNLDVVLDLPHSLPVSYRRIQSILKKLLHAFSDYGMKGEVCNII